MFMKKLNSILEEKYIRFYVLLFISNVFYKNVVAPYVLFERDKINGTEKEFLKDASSNFGE